MFSMGSLIFNNPIFSIFFLILTFLGSSFVFIAINSHFLAFCIIIIYLGALIVLFLFVIMMLNLRLLELNRIINFYPFFFGFLAFLLLSFYGSFFNSFSEFNLVLFSGRFQEYFYEWLYLYFANDIFTSISFIFYIFFWYPFLLISVSLFIGMLGSIVLTLSKIKSNIRRQKVINQVLAEKEKMYSLYFKN